MKKIIWGAGFFGRLCAIQLGVENVDYFIDINPPRSGNCFGKKVLTPDEVTEWENIFVYVPYNFYYEIADLLKKKGLEENTRFTKYDDAAILDYSLASEEYDRAFKEVIHEGDSTESIKNAAWGGFWASKSNYSAIYREIIKRYNLFLFSETIGWNQNEAKRILGVNTVILPAFMTSDHVYVNAESVSSHEELVDNAMVRRYVNYLLKQPRTISKKSAFWQASKTYSYIENVLETYKPKCLIIGGSDALVHKLIREISKKNGTRVLFSHPSVLPGTISMDPSGDVGDSIPCLYSEAFRNLPVENRDIENADKVLAYLRDSKLNRKIQPKTEWKISVEKRLLPKRPIVFYAGQKDIDCSMVPYTQESKQYHSPVFKSTFEASVYLARVCRQNNWNFIYKPHPMYIRKNEQHRLPDNVIYVPYADINDLIDFVDVVVTIRSTTNYVALIRKKPVLMLGYTQTRNQGCTYEAFERRSVEPMLRTAVAKGFTSKQDLAFREHVARMLKYYLYDDMSDRQLRYGLPLPDDCSMFFDLENRLKAMNDENRIWD